MREQVIIMTVKTKKVKVKQEVLSMFGLVPFERRRNQLQTRDPGLFDIDRVFENFFNDSVFPSMYNRSGMMKVDISEEDDRYILEADLPGISKDQVNVELEDDRLTISVNYEDEEEEKNKNYVRRERRACSMVRSFNAADVNGEAIEATMTDGVLRLVLPKKEPDQQKRKSIQIQ